MEILNIGSDEESMRYSGNIFTLEELKVTIGVVVASGVVSQSRRRDYWSSYELKKNHLIAKSISRNKFEMIFSSLHFLLSTALPANDRYQKIRILLSKLNKRFLQYAPSTNAFSIDEAMVPYYGRHGCKQRIKGKPIRFGFKLWCVATTLGYALCLQPYPCLAEKPNDSYDFESSGNVVYFFADILKEIRRKVL